MQKGGGKHACSSVAMSNYFSRRVPEESVDAILNYCHNNLADNTLTTILPYLQKKGVSVISASFSSMGLLTQKVTKLTLELLCAKELSIYISPSLWICGVYPQLHSVPVLARSSIKLDEKLACSKVSDRICLVWKIASLSNASTVRWVGL